MVFFSSPLLISIFCLAVVGCQSNTTIPEKDPQLLEVRSIPFPDHPRELTVIQNPDISGETREDFVFSNSKEQEESVDIAIEILEKWDDAFNYFTHVNFMNLTDRDITKTVYVLHYDKLGRLIESSSTNTYFRANNHFIQRFVFPKNGIQTRWIIKVR
ncbi:MAG: hypothetical protein AABZ60_15405 [Planctomycetota bacterium]